MRNEIIYSAIGLLFALLLFSLFFKPFQRGDIRGETIVAANHYEKVTEVSLKMPLLSEQNPVESSKLDQDKFDRSEKKVDFKGSQSKDIEQSSAKKVTYQVEKANGNFLVQTDHLNVRSGADPSYAIIGKLTLGTEVDVTGKTDNGWYQITFNDQNGFVNGSYLTDKKVKHVEDMDQDSPTYIHGVLLANKDYPLPANFAPGESKEARNAFNQMNVAAKKDGLELIAFSTYRSYDYQKGLYDEYVARDGKEAADRYSARPGYSEHQTGLAFDIGEVGQEGSWFQESDATRWMAKHAHKFGFIVRYPEGKEHITGYMYEPWHMRYLGVDLATEVYESGLSLEEFLGVK